MIARPKHGRRPFEILLSLGSPLGISSYSVVVASASNRSSPRPSSDHQSHDLVGPPSPRSNLRPIQYASLFPPSTKTEFESLQSSPSPDANSSHPYSLNEFTSQPGFMPSSLAELRNRLSLEDLEWTIFRKRIDRSNDSFWATQSTNFEALEEAERTRLLASIDSSEAFSLTSVAERQELVDAALHRFYQKWVSDEQTRFRSYNFEWWKVQVGLLRGSWKAQKRVWQWQWACWNVARHPSSS